MDINKESNKFTHKNKLMEKYNDQSKYVVLESYAGDTFSKVAEHAKITAERSNKIAVFEFNGRNIMVDKDSNLELIQRDYSNSWSLGWEEVGPHPKAEYSTEELEIMRLYNEEQERKQRQYEQEAKVKQQQKEAQIKEQTTGIIMQFKPDMEAEWDKGLANNQDGYGKAIYQYAEQWALLMQAVIDPTGDIQKQIVEVAEKTSHTADTEGITGFMYGAAISTLAAFWIYGEELRKWHNKEYGHEGEGVVNPAVLTIK